MADNALRAKPVLARARGSTDQRAWSGLVWSGSIVLKCCRRVALNAGGAVIQPVWWLPCALFSMPASRWTRSDSGTLRGIWHFVFLISVCGTECCWYCWYYVLLCCCSVLLLCAACGRGRVRLRDTRRARTGLSLQPPPPPSPPRLSTRPHGHPRLIRLTIAAPGVRT